MDVGLHRLYGAKFRTYKFRLEIVTIIVMVKHYRGAWFETMIDYNVNSHSNILGAIFPGLGEFLPGSNL